jgi:hypothetical protein
MPLLVYNRITADWQTVPNEAWLELFPDVLRPTADPVGPDLPTQPNPVQRKRLLGELVADEQPLAENPEPPAYGDQPRRSEPQWP